MPKLALITGTLIGLLLGGCEPKEQNMYGGVNYTHQVYGYKVLIVPDEESVVKCSYLVSENIDPTTLHEYDCEDGQGTITINGDD